MKAQEWVNNFDENKKEDFFKEYAEETSSLITLRTRGSGIIERKDKKIDTKPTAVAGAIREQKQKWGAICRKLAHPAITEDMFDKIIMGFYLPAVVSEQAKWQEQQQKEQEAETVTAPAKRTTTKIYGRVLANNTTISLKEES